MFIVQVDMDAFPTHALLYEAIVTVTSGVGGGGEWREGGPLIHMYLLHRFSRLFRTNVAGCMPPPSAGGGSRGGDSGARVSSASRHHPLIVAP